MLLLREGTETVQGARGCNVREEYTSSWTKSGPNVTYYHDQLRIP